MLRDPFRVRFRPALAALLVLSWANPVAAVDPPELLSYQGMLLDSQGVMVPDGLYTLRFELYTQATQGTAVFAQDLSVEVRDGLYNVVLSTHGTNDLGDVAAQNANLFMQVTILADGGAVPTDVVLSPRQQLASVPYALNAPAPPPPTLPPSAAYVPLGAIILWDSTTSCPSGYANVPDYAGRFLAGTDLAGVSPEIEDLPGTDGGGTNASKEWRTSGPTAVTGIGQVGPIVLPHQGHKHDFTPPYRTVLLCRRTT